MNLVKLIQFLRDRLKAVIWIGCVVLALVVVLDAIPAIVDKEHAHTGPEHWPAFWAVFGFLGCVVIVLFSKWFGHLGIMTREDYYEDGSAAGAEDRNAAFTRQGVNSHGGLPPKGGVPGKSHGQAPKGGHHE